MGKPNSSLQGFWDTPIADILQHLAATPTGLSTREAARRLDLYGPNSLARKSRFATLVSFLSFFANPLVVILMVASAVSLVLGDPIGGSIILAMIVLSVLLNFFMEFQARNAVEEIQKQVATTTVVVRDGKEQELPVADLVRGDVIRLNAGDLVPADARLLEAKDLQIREAALTGESLPVEKTAHDLPPGKHAIADASNCIFLGTAVQTGMCSAIIVATGKNSALGEIALRLAENPPETEFGRGIRSSG